MDESRTALVRACAPMLAGALAVSIAPSSAAAEPPIHVAAPSRADGATVARIVTPTRARARLAASERGRLVDTQTEWSGQPQTLLVLQSATRDGRDWVKLLLPGRPNGSTGWVPRDNVVLSHVPYWIDVRTRARRVTTFRNGSPIRRFAAVVGKPATPTPHGLAAVYELNRQPNARGFLGPWSLSLTVHSDVLQSFGGGPGRVAIHGRAGRSLRDPLGSARSHGCIRILNRHVSWLAAHIPRGTPVQLRR